MNGTRAKLEQAVYTAIRVNAWGPDNIRKVVDGLLDILQEPEGNGQRYAAGEWSRRNAEAFVSDIREGDA